MKMAHLAAFILGFSLWAVAAPNDFEQGKPDIKSLSVLAFGPEGVLFLGDSIGGAVFAVQLDDKTQNSAQEPLDIPDLEGKIAALLGTRAEDILVHDLAVNPLSQNVYVSVSRGRSKWNDRWQLPNDLSDATILLRISPSAQFSEVGLENVRFARAVLPNPVSEDKMHSWKAGTRLRVDTITDLAYSEGRLFVAGLSNEEFASTMWQMPYPFQDSTASTTLEIYHGAHGEYETHAPIRTFLPFTLHGQDHLLASYLCTPLVTFPVTDLHNGKHVRGRTIAEFGYGNYPLDMLRYRKEGKDFILIANANLPFIILDPEKLERYQGEITQPVDPDQYTAGVDFTPRSGVGIQQMDTLNSKFVLTLVRMPSGKLNLVSYPVERF